MLSVSDSTSDALTADAAREDPPGLSGAVVMAGGIAERLSGEVAPGFGCAPSVAGVAGAA